MKAIICVYLIIILSSCNKVNNEHNLILDGNNYYFVKNNDSLKLGNERFENQLFQKLKQEVHSNTHKVEEITITEKEILENIRGIYINKKIFDSFKLEDGELKTFAPQFDIIYIFPEVVRYNFQFTGILGYRIFHYLGYLYQESSNNQNLSYYVQNISKINNNSLLITYIDKSTFKFGDNYDKLDSLNFSTFPSIKFNFSDKNLENFQESKEYIKLSDEIIDNIKLSVSPDMLPQDVTEYYIREIVTKLINTKLNTSFSTNDLLKLVN